MEFAIRPQAIPIDACHPPAPAITLIEDEDGTISFMAVIAILFLLILSALVANAAMVVNQKMEVQSASDAVAYSSSLIMARGMNAVTSANHLMGELQALVVLQHALGGEEADNSREPSMKPGETAIRTELDAAFIAAEATLMAQPNSSVYQNVRKRPKAGATIHDSVVRLQQVLGWTYEAMAAGGALMDLAEVPYVGPAFYAAGETILIAARVFETKVNVERKILEALEEVAHDTSAIKKGLEELIVGIYFGYARRLEFEVPRAITNAVDSLSGENHVSGAVYPRPTGLPVSPFLKLPVQSEPENLQAMHKSQLVRASFPWVNHWRTEVLTLMREFLRLSRTAYYYKYYTNKFTLDKARDAKTNRHVNLQIMVDTDLERSEKGREPWTKNSRRADQLFCVVGFAHRPPPTLSGAGIYSVADDDGVMGYAQGMIYNANPQKPGACKEHQLCSFRNIAWDTLNWNETWALEHNMNGGNTSDKPTEQPQVLVNWQAKLVPVTRLTESVTQLSNPFRSLVFRLIPHPDIFKTH